MELYRVNQFIRDTYGEKLYKIPLTAGKTCPNRDGKKGIGGCIFCSSKGSGEFIREAEQSVTRQLEAGKKLLSGKTDCKKFIAYFQSFTNTYGDKEYLRKRFLEAALHPDVAVVSIATRPDCIDDAVISIIREIQCIKPVWVELGLQTMHESTAALINRCYSLKEYEDGIKKLQETGVHIIVHMIIGLPGEGKQQIVETADYIGKSGADGIKLQLLHVLKGTVLHSMYEKEAFEVLTMEEYIDILLACLKVLPEGMVIHRLTGDGARNILVAPLWSLDKKRVLNALNKAIADA